MIGLREDQQMKASLVDYLNHIVGHCGRGKPPPTVDSGGLQAGGWVCCIEGRSLTSAYQAASWGLSNRHCISGWRKSR